jgi:hypothetical protein
MKPKQWRIPLFAGMGFTGWRLLQQGQLARRFVAADVDPGDASIAAAQLIPFWSFVTYADLTNTIESAAPAGQVDATYNEFAGDAWLMAQGNN